jgi:hypothetical protein
VDFVKIDVQGFEGHVLAGLERTIRNSPGLILMVEFWPSGLKQAGTDPRGFLEMLEAFGLTLHELLDRGHARAIPKNKDVLIHRYSNRQYTNIIGYGSQRLR